LIQRDVSDLAVHLVAEHVEDGRNRMEAEVVIDRPQRRSDGLLVRVAAAVNEDALDRRAAFALRSVGGEREAGSFGGG
jgi:hypothetical protein